MKQAEESVSRSTCKSIMRPAKEDRKSHRLRKFRDFAQRKLFLYWNELLCKLKLTILEDIEECPEKPFVAKKIQWKALAADGASLVVKSSFMAPDTSKKFWNESTRFIDRQGPTFLHWNDALTSSFERLKRPSGWGTASMEYFHVVRLYGLDFT